MFQTLDSATSDSETVKYVIIIPVGELLLRTAA